MGLPRYTAKELEGRRAYFRDRDNRRHVSGIGFLADYKMEKGCADCGYREHPAALDFDHLPGQLKVGQISRMRTKSPEAVIAEIAKCEVVCANCHRIRTFNRRRQRRDAG